MRAMRKGDLAFFYHSNTKVPGVAGIMEIVEEHSIDGTPIKADPARSHTNIRV
jgi:predicted RNA-binding protein with PUA-like domain